uniref:Ras association domain-containing protein 10 n=1 Tax=Geotrypetes seraphini TaxID=260995 RepID=A0A6P8PQR1_GEOSA|nr:ras association domain-containing protein 10 [Geotrypetes seraphini]
MEAEECKISVWLCQEEKLVSGLSRRTTCSDVVQVLLDDHDQSQQPGALLSGPPRSYCVVEKWRGFERILPNKTKILRLWTAWGEEQENVRFVVVRSDASLPNAGPRSAEARVVPSKESPGGLRGAARMALTLSQEKQRRVVRKAFRKLAKINRRRQEALPKDSAAVERMETLVHLVLSQDHTIRQQVQRIKELDRDIDRYEAKVHLERVQRHGANYVQDTYLDGPGPDEGAGAERDAQALALLQELIGEQERLRERLAGQMEEELNRRWMERRREELAGAEGEPEQEQERLKTQLSASLYIGLRLSSDLEAIGADLDHTQRAGEAQEAELRTLQDALRALDAPDSPAPGFPPDSPGGWAEALAKEGEANDEDSDTGLSSMHSQDSDSAPAPSSESLV